MLQDEDARNRSNCRPCWCMLMPTSCT